MTAQELDDRIESKVSELVERKLGELLASEKFSPLLTPLYREEYDGWKERGVSLKEEREGKEERETKTISPLRGPRKMLTADQLPVLDEAQVYRIARKSNVSMDTAMQVYDTMVDYCLAHGKGYRDYQAALRNFIKSELADGKVKPTVMKAPKFELSPEMLELQKAEYELELMALIKTERA